jgi:DNA replication protein DnaC
VFLGPPGTGKTHLAIALGLKAVQQGYRTLFTAALPLIAALNEGLRREPVGRAAEAVLSAQAAHH